MYYIFVCLSKVFQRTIFLSCSRFQWESVCKGKAFFLSLQIFPKFFSKKFFRMTSRGLSFSRSLAVSQGKILGCSAFSKSASLCQSVILSGSPSRKRLQRYALFPLLQLLRNTFLRIFWRFFVNRCEQDGCRWTFFDAFKKERKRHYIMYFARAYVRAHERMCKRERQRYTPNRYKKLTETRKSLLRNFPARRPKTGKTSENAGNGVTSPP